MNVQFAVKDGDVYLIEVNPRASRTVPFVAKAIGRPIAKIAARVMAGEPLCGFDADRPRHRPYRGQGAGVPVRALPRDRPGARTGNEEHRRSHGNRSGFRHRLRQGAARRGDRAAATAARRSCRSRTPTRTISSRRSRSCSSSASRSSPPAAPPSISQAKGLPVERVNKVAQGRPHIVDRLLDGDVDLVFNTTEGWQSLKDSHSIRATALDRKVPYFTTAAASLAAARSIEAVRGARA